MIEDFGVRGRGYVGRRGGSKGDTMVVEVEKEVVVEVWRSRRRILVLVDEEVMGIKEEAYGHQREGGGSQGGFRTRGGGGS